MSWGLHWEIRSQIRQLRQYGRSPCRAAPPLSKIWTDSSLRRRAEMKAGSAFPIRSISGNGNVRTESSRSAGRGRIPLSWRATGEAATNSVPIRRRLFREIQTVTLLSSRSTKRRKAEHPRGQWRRRRQIPRRELWIPARRSR